MTKNVIDALFPATQTSKNPSERTDTYWLTQYSPNATTYTDEWCGSWYIDVTEKM